MNDYRPDWIGAIGAGIAALISFAIANALVKRPRNQTKFYLIFVTFVCVLAFAIREALRLFGI
jgi:hypothetical protein